MSLPRCFFQPGAAEDSQDPPVCLLLFLEPTVGERVVGARPAGSEEQCIVVWITATEENLMQKQ